MRRRYRTEESDKGWVKVDSDKAHLGLLSEEEVLVELLFRVSLDTLLPVGYLLLVVLPQVLAEREVELLDIFELLSVLDRLRELGELLHWLVDSLQKAVGPVEGAGNWRQVLEDRCLLVV